MRTDLISRALRSGFGPSAGTDESLLVIDINEAEAGALQADDEDSGFADGHRNTCHLDAAGQARPTFDLPAPGGPRLATRHSSAH